MSGLSQCGNVFLMSYFFCPFCILLGPLKSGRPYDSFCPVKCQQGDGIHPWGLGEVGGSGEVGSDPQLFLLLLQTEAVQDVDSLSPSP